VRLLVAPAGRKFREVVAPAQQGEQCVALQTCHILEAL
jgi:hypothetical protein